ASSAPEIPATPDRAAALVLLVDSALERNRWLEAAKQPAAAGWGLLVTLGRNEPGTKPLDRPPQAREPKVDPPRVSARGSLRAAFAEKRVAKLEVQAPVRTPEQQAVNVVGRIAGA